MTDVQKRAIKKTVITVLLIAIMVAIVFTFPFLGGYFVLAFFLALGVGMIYGMFEMLESSRDWDKRRR